MMKIWHPVITDVCSTSCKIYDTMELNLVNLDYYLVKRRKLGAMIQSLDRNYSYGMKSSVIICHGYMPLLSEVADGM